MSILALSFRLYALALIVVPASQYALQLATGWARKFNDRQSPLCMASTSTSPIDGSALSPEQWLECVFDGLRPRDFLTDRSKCSYEELKHKGFVINAPQRMMSIPLIDFNATAAVKTVLSTTVINPDPREKSLCAIVRGSGGGKTRAVEETCIGILCEHPNVLPVPITFNGYTSVDDDSWDSEGVTEPRMFYALAVVSRMGSAVFNESWPVVQRRMEDMLSLLQYNTNQKVVAVALIRGFVAFAVRTINASNHTAPPIDTFVLMLDEVVLMENRIESRFPARILGIEATSSCVQAMLNEEICIPSRESPTAMSRINVGMVVSSLKVNSIGQTYSGRKVKPIRLPAQLNAVEVAEKVFRRHFLELSEAEEHTLRLCAAMLGALPRLVQVAEDFIISWACTSVPLDARFVSQLFEWVRSEIGERYSLPSLPSDSVLKAIIFQRELKLSDEEVLSSIRCSYITNSLDTFREDTSIDKAESSIMMLAVGASRSRDSKVGEFLDVGIRAVLQQMERCSAGQKGSIADPIGYLLETTCYHWLRVRLACLVTSSSSGRSGYAVEECSPMRLLGIPQEAVLEEFYPWIRSLYKAIPEIVLSSFEPPRLMCSYRKKRGEGSDEELDKAARAAAFNDWEKNHPVSKFQPVRVMRASSGEAFDVCVKLYVDDGSGPVYIFIDLKSKLESAILEKRAQELRNQVEIKTTTEEDLPKKGAQAEWVQKIFRENCKGGGSVAGQGEGETAGDRPRYLFIYMQTDAVETQSLPELNAVVLGRRDTLEFFGPIASLYQAARSVLLKQE